MAGEDPLNRRVVEQMLVGVATRQYARSLDTLPTTLGIDDTGRKHALGLWDDRELNQPHETWETERETGARRPDGAALDAAAMLEAVKGFRRLKGHKDMPKLLAGLRARDQQLGLEVSTENVA